MFARGGCVRVFGGVDFFCFFCFGLSVLKSARWAGYIKGRARCSCVAAGSVAPLQHSDCDPSLRVCVCFHSLCTHSLRCSRSPPLFSSFSLLPPCVPCRTEPQILKILPLVYLACLCLSFSLLLLPYISPDSPLSSPFFFPFIYLLQVLSLSRSIPLPLEASRPM